VTNQWLDLTVACFFHSHFLIRKYCDNKLLRFLGSNLFQRLLFYLYRGSALYGIIRINDIEPPRFSAPRLATKAEQSSQKMSVENLLCTSSGSCGDAQSSNGPSIEIAWFSTNSAEAYVIVWSSTEDFAYIVPLKLGVSRPDHSLSPLLSCSTNLIYGTKPAASVLCDLMGFVSGRISEKSDWKRTLFHDAQAPIWSR